MLALHTIGHSTRSAEEFAALLAASDIRLVVDVRRFPGSRRYPHFNGAAMADWLAAAGIDYRHEPALGGRRRPQADSPNGYWQNASFRAFADYQQTAEFQAALGRLMELAGERMTTILCAESLPWRCHRRLIADALVAHGRTVFDILGPGHVEPYQLNPHAVIQPDGTLRYPAAAESRQRKLPEFD